MLTPVRSNSLVSSQLVLADPTSVQSASPDPKAKATMPDVVGESGAQNSKVSKLADLLAGSEKSISNPLIKLALAIARSINFQQRPNEIADAYRQRLIDFLLDMKPDEQAEVEQKSNLRFFDITLPLLAEAMKDHATPMAAKLIVMIEQAASQARLPFEDQASHIYEHGEDSLADMADSLKYRSLPPQGELLEADPTPENAKLREPAIRQAHNEAPNQTELVRAFVDELYEATMSLEDLFTPEEEHETGQNSSLPEPQDFTANRHQNDESAGPVTSTGAKGANDLSLAGVSGLLAKTEVKTLTGGETLAGSVADEADLADRTPILEEGLPRTDAENRMAPLKAGIQAMISERLTSFAGLLPRVSERQVSAAVSPASAQATATQTETPAPVAAEETPQRAPINLRDPAFVAKLTTLFLKDLPPATLAKLQVIADLLIANELGLLSEFLSEGVKSTEGNDAKSPLPTAGEFTAKLTEERTKDQPILPRADAPGKLDDATTPSVIRNTLISDDPEQPVQTQGRNPLIGAATNPSERVAQQIQLFNMLAFAPIPYPIVEEQDPPTSSKRNEERDGSEEREDEGEHSNSQSDQENRNQHQETKQDERTAEADNPFAPDVELKRHASDAERAFHMYQKMGGF